MAITRRVTKTITEHFDSATSYDNHGTEAPQSPSNLLDVKRKSTLGDFQDSEVHAQPENTERINTEKILSPVEFSQSAKNWIVHHLVGFIATTVVLFGSAASMIWIGGSIFGGIEKDIDSLKSDISEVRLESKESTKALQRIETQLSKAERPSNSSPKK